MRRIGTVLAGGASRRMGRDKATLRLSGERLVDLAVARLDPLCDRVVVADRGRGLVADRLSLEDGPGSGPAAALLGAAARFPQDELLVLACDLPGVPAALLAALAEEPGDLVLPTTTRGIEPLCGVYRPRALAALLRRVEAGRFALHPLVGDPELSVRLVGPHELARWGTPETLFRNLNSPQDLPPT